MNIYEQGKNEPKIKIEKKTFEISFFAWDFFFGFFHLTMSNLASNQEEEKIH